MVPYDSFVARTLKQVLADARKLSPEDQAVARAELDDPQDDPRSVEQAWREEVVRRVEEVERGEVELLDADQALTKLKKRFPRRR
jgi:hypothetical protein